MQSAAQSLKNVPPKSPARGGRLALAIGLGVLSLLIVFFHIAYVIWTLVLLMELTQVEPRFFVTLFCITDLASVILWLLLHRLYVAKYRPTVDGHLAHKAGTIDVSRVFGVQMILFIFVLWISAISLIFSSRWTGAIAPGDGHVVQNGMDTKSGIYTLWLQILFNIVIGSIFVISMVSYILDLYFRQFTYGPKPKY